MTTQAIRVVCTSVLAVLLVAAPASAQATRTWVSNTGDDVNPCSRSAPCRTFVGALSKTATGGYINVMDDGSFGGVSIGKSITIDGDGGQSMLLAAGGGTGITVNGASIVVSLRNLNIESSGGGTGLNVVNAATVHVENVRFTNFTTYGINFNPSGANAKLFMDNVQILNVSGGAGVYVRNGRASLERVFVSGSQSGIVSGAGGLTFVKDSVVTGCSMGFATAYSPTAVIDVHDSLSTDNDWGIVAGSGATARVGNTTITDNHLYGLYNDGASFIVSMGTNRLISNAIEGTFTSTVAIR
jgi:hypothetical protein